MTPAGSADTVLTDTVSVVLVNFNGLDDTLVAVDHLSRCHRDGLDLEIVVVDNASAGDDLERLRQDPRIVVVPSSENLGFAGGCNLGVRRSSGRIVAFLNNDARPDEDWIVEGVAPFEDASVGAVASRVLDWDGTRVDYIGSAMTWYGMGYKPFTGEPLPRSEPRPDRVLFGTGSAMFVRRDVFLELGGFDERYFMFFEDVDLGWRINLRGWRFAYAADSIAYHRHHRSMDGIGHHRERYLLERNALFTLFKNLEQPTLDRVLPAAMALSVRRSLAVAGVDAEQFDLRRRIADEPADLPVPRDALVAPFAIDGFVTELPGLRAERESVQRTRVVSDSRIWQLFGLADAPVLHIDSFTEGYENIVQTFPVVEPPSAARTLIITGDPLGEQMAGPAIRSWHIATALAARGHEVVLVSMTRAEREDPAFRTQFVPPGDDRAMAPLEAWAELIVFQGLALEYFPSLQRSTTPMAIDVYDPMHLEQLEQARSHGKDTWSRAVSDATRVLNDQLRRADFLFCASERQRRFYLGQLAALGRLSPETYAGDPDFRRLIDVVPFGLEDAPPEHREAVLRGVRPGIEAEDELLIWAGGLYDWFDPETLIRAVALLAERRPRLRLFFLGTKHPHPHVPEMPIVARSRELAAELGVLDRHVFFNDRWVDYDRRGDYLTEADLGVTTHFEHIETDFSFRTRILDYLWAGLPIVSTRGDHFAELIENEGLGAVVRERDPDALAAAIESLLEDAGALEAAKSAVARVRTRFRWSTVLDPLLDYAAAPWHAGDRTIPRSLADQRAIRPERPGGLRHDLRLVAHHLRESGPRTVAVKVARRMRRG